MSSPDACEARTVVGPVQVLVVGFGDDRFTGEILPELKRLKEHDVIRLIDLLFVTKDESGNIAALQQTDLSREEMMEFGAFVGALVGFGAGGEEEAEAAAVAGAAELEDAGCSTTRRCGTSRMPSPKERPPRSR